MKSLAFKIALFGAALVSVLSLTNFAHATDATGDVSRYYIKRATDTRFQFVAEVTGDNCNSISLITELNLVSRNPAKKQRTYKVEYTTLQTVMGCEDMRPVPATAYSQTYMVPAGDEVRFIVPSNMKIQILD